MAEPITVCPKCQKPAFVITCNACGHRGCHNDCERHDCYWVFRERRATKIAKGKK
jgi:hypothetical protein